MPILTVVVSLLSTLFGAGTDPECLALGGLDVVRAEALANVDVSALTSVYADESAAAADRRLLQRYAARGFRVVGSGVVREACHVVRRGPDHVELAVTERARRAWAVTESGQWRRLPGGGPVHHRIVLRGGPGTWRVGSVEASSEG